MDNVATTREPLLSTYSTMSKQWTFSYSEVNRHQLLNLLLRPQCQEVTRTMRLIDDDDSLTASIVTVTGQTGSPLAETEVEEETDLFLKTVANTLWGFLCVLDNLVI